MANRLREELAWEHISWETLRTTSHLGPYQLQIFDMGTGHARPIWLTLFGEPKPETGDPNILFEHAFKTIEEAKAAAEPMMLKYLDEHGLPGVESYLKKPTESWLESWEAGELPVQQAQDLAWQQYVTDLDTTFNEVSDGDMDPAHARFHVEQYVHDMGIRDFRSVNPEVDRQLNGVPVDLEDLLAGYMRRQLETKAYLKQMLRDGQPFIAEVRGPDVELVLPHNTDQTLPVCEGPDI